MYLTEHDSLPRRRSPWPGSQYQTRHRWQLDLVSSLADAAQDLRDIAAELTAAHDAGWSLAEPMSSGHLLAVRASRRMRARTPGPPPDDGNASPPAVRWRLRVIDEAPAPGHEVFDTANTDRTPVLAWTGHSLDQLSGPAVPADVLADTIRQVTPTGLPHRLWGLAAARVGRSFDLVAHGSALRVHAVKDGTLVRTREALTFQHAADGAATLRQAAAAYERLAAAADAMAAAGGRLADADDGLVYVDYDGPA